MSEAGRSRKLAAILAADVAGYSRLMTLDDRATIQALNESRTVFRDRIERHGGQVIDMAGDGVLAEFPSAVEAMQCAMEVQAVLQQRNQPLAEEKRMLFRIGVNVGDIIAQQDGTIYGDGVNIAARLETIGEPGGVCVSGTVFDQVKNQIEAVFEFLGEQQVKNIADPVRTFRVRADNLSKAGGTAAASAGRAVLALPDKPSSAVLPFDNMSADLEQEFFADGVVEAITVTLSRIRLDVVSALVGAGRMEAAAVEFKTLTTAYPDLNVTRLKQAMVLTPATLGRLAANLRKCGLPD